MGSKAKHILILERDGGVAQTVHSMAQVLGHDPRICASTDEALAELSRKQKPFGLSDLEQAIGAAARR